MDRKQLAVILEEQVEYAVSPVTDVGAMSKITQRLLRRTLFAFFQRELVTKIDQEFAIAVSLPSWKYHDAGQVVVNFCLLLFTKVTHHVVAIGLPLAEHVKVEGVNLKPNVLVI